MAESLRDLVVSLSLNTDNFTRNIKSVNKQIQEAESYFKMAAAGVTGFDASTEGLTSKLSMLERKLQLQKEVVTQYERALAQATAKLTECYNRQPEYAKKLEEAKAKQAALKEEVKQSSEAYQKLKKQLGENDKATIDAKAEMEKAKEAYKASTEEVNKLSGQQDALRRATQNAADAVSTQQTQLNKAKAAVKETQAALKETNAQLITAQSKWTAAGKALNSFSEKCSKFSETTGKLGRTLTTYVTTPITALGATALKAGIEFESAFTGVRKTVDTSEAEFIRLENSVKQMSTEIAASTSDISDVMAVAGQLGIKTDALENFTRVMIDLGNSTDIVAQDAGSTLAKFANIMGMDQTKFENLGSTLVDLGNNYATTESAIMEMSLRLAGAGKQVGLTEAQILGFSTALSSVGIEAQMGGSALSKALIKMEVAAATGGETLEDFSAVCGMTTSQFKQMWEADPAAVFQQFIEGLARFDDEGLSAIAVLQEIGISEIRLRDTMLRAVNATELFSSTQETAKKAWAENTALSEEAGKRYATTASKLTNLKNKSMLFAMQLGDDLSPTIQNLIGGADGLIDKFMSMDEAERMQIIQMVAFAASIGPVLLATSKVSKGLSLLTGSLGKFATGIGVAIGKAGGFAPFLASLAASPAIWFAVAAAVAVGTVALIAGAVALTDYATGAKKAREALEGMNKTAEKWKETAAETLYSRNEGLSFFGMSAEDFKGEGDKIIKDGKTWLSDLTRMWASGQRETNAVVKDWTGSFQEGSDAIRESLTSMKVNADAKGYTGLSAQLQGDLDTLNSIDKEIGKLLKKHQNKRFTEKDQVRLQELVNTREALQIKYNLVPAEDAAVGFDEIRRRVEAEIARAQALGKGDASITVYENAIVAAAQGLAEVNSQIDDNYDKEYALIQMIDDSSEREAALADLNTRYVAERRAAALEYAALMADVSDPVFQRDNIKKTMTDLDLLTQKLRAYSLASEADKPQLLAELNELTAGMDESSLVEYLGLLTQIQTLLDSGLTEAEIASYFPEIDYTTALAKVAAIMSYLGGRESLFPGLAAMFGEALPEEMLTLATDLDMTGAMERWNRFAKDPGAITTEAVITDYQEGQEARARNPVISALISRYTEIPEGADKRSLTPEGVVAYVTKYAEVTNGADVSGLTPEIAEALVAGYKELSTGADTSALKPDEIVAYVRQYAEALGVDLSGLKPEGLTAFVMAYEEINGGALTEQLTPTDISAIVTQYLLDSNVDLSKITDPQVDALVTAYAEATNCDKSALKAEVQARIVEYVEAENVQKPGYITMQVGISGYDLMAYNKFIKENPVTVTGLLRLGEVTNDPADILQNGSALFWKDGQQIEVEAVPREQLTPQTVAALDADGTMHILLTPQLSGDKEVIEELQKEVAEVDTLGVTALGMASGIEPVTIMGRVRSAVGRLKSFQQTKDYGFFQKFWAGLWGATTNENILNQSMINDFTPGTLASLTTYVSEMVTAIKNGGTVAEADLENLKEIVDFLNLLELSGVGENVTAGIGEGMASAGWEVDAESVAGNLEAALNKALGINSPSRRMIPVGGYVSAGVGEGAAEYDFSGDANAVADGIFQALTEALTGGDMPAALAACLSGLADTLMGFSWASSASTIGGNLRSALNGVLSGGIMQSVGINAMAGMRAGIMAGTPMVVQAMRTAAQASVDAAKDTLMIRSPSHVFEKDIGVMTMKGFGKGVIGETKNQEKIIRNASRYLTRAARSGVTAENTTNNNTYDQSSMVTLTGNTFSIRDQQDAYALAAEIAALTRRKQRGYGARLA